MNEIIEPNEEVMKIYTNHEKEKLKEKYTEICI